MKFSFKKATKSQSKLRLALAGPSGSGKTYTALRIGTHLAKLAGGRLGVIDTERGSASKYAGRDGFDFDVLELESFAPATYVGAIRAAADAGVSVLVIDSLSHAWAGKGGALEMVDNAAARSNSKNSYMAWRNVTPEHNALVDAILQSPIHVIATMRSKTEYVLEKDSKGNSVPRKIGMAPIQRDGMEYEFDLFADIDLEHRFVVSKSRCHALSDAVVMKAGEDVAQALHDWLSDGAPALPPPVEFKAVVDAVTAHYGDNVDARKGWWVKAFGLSEVDATFNPKSLFEKLGIAERLQLLNDAKALKDDDLPAELGGGS